MKSAGTVFIRNFGCRVNQAEAFDWADEFRKRGWRLDEDDARSRLIVVNTCTLTARADRDVRKYIRKTARENPQARIVVTGCLAERDPEGIGSLPGVWKVVPNAGKPALPGLCAAAEAASDSAAPRTAASARRARALVKIQDGCDMRCSFCLIPSVRGRSVSRSADDIAGRLEELTAAGFREIVLAGIHLSSWGRDLRPVRTLSDLLERIERVAGDFRLRLTSLDPRLLPDPLLAILTGSRRICPHFHLSLQNGSNRILKAMGRASTAESYRDLFERIIRRSPAANLGADFIVGFPGETEEDFEATFALLAEAPLRYAHVFSFSPRPGTAAAAGPAVDAAAVKSRAGRLRRLSAKKNLAYRQRFAGRTLEGIVIQRKPGGVEILTSNYLDVLVPDGGEAEGSAVRVRIDRVAESATTGVLCGKDRDP